MESMQQQEKNGSASLIIMLSILVLFLIYQFVLVPYVFTKKEGPGEDEGPKKTETEILTEMAEDFYKAFFLSLEEESVYTPSDENELQLSLSVYKMSDVLKLYYGIKNVDSKYITKDAGYSLKEASANANGNYYYGGNYIMTAPIEEKVKELFGDLPYTHQDITLDNTRYVYNEAKDLYEIWVVKTKTQYTKQKITHKDIAVTSNSIMIYEYIAYTDYEDPENIFSSTIHYPSIEVIITEENVKDNLNYMDKYRYTFEKAEDGKFYFKLLEYMVE